MGKSKNKSGRGGFDVAGLGGLFGGLSSMLEKLGELAEKGEQLRKSGEFQSRDGKIKGVYGFNIRCGLNDEEIKIEPFGNVRKDKQTGKAVVHEVREPMVDVFEENECILVVAEMPGVGEQDVQLELKDDILTIETTRSEKKYRKEVLLPRAFSADKMSHTCRNGILEVRLNK